MKNLLTNQENRRLKFVETLTFKNDWIILADLSTILNCSTRVLKNDIVFLNETFDDFTIHTSIYGIRIEYLNNHNFKSFCQKVMMQSDAYQLLELIFINENITIQSISKRLNISLSTLYRLIDDLNVRLKDEYGFYIQKGPSRLVGSEKNIRYFFYTYFYEKDIYNHWPFEDIDDKNVDLIITELVSKNNLPAAFIYSDVIKVILMVNYIRYRQNNLITSDFMHKYTKQFTSCTMNDNDFNILVEKTLGFTFNEEFVEQVLDQFVQKGLFYSYNHFLTTRLTDKTLNSQSQLFYDILNKIAVKNKIPLVNFEHLELAIFNVAHLEYQDAHSSYILYNHNGQFANEIKNEFPLFYQDLYEGMELFRKKLNKPLTEEGIYLYMVTIFSWWKNLVPELRKKLDKIRVLVVSDRDYSHAQMLKDFLSFEFNEQLQIKIYNEPIFNPDFLQENQFELVIGSFTSNELNLIPSVYISHLPKTEDYFKIQEHIDQILWDRLEI